MLKLLLESGELVELTGSAITIGSKPGCHLVIENDRRIRDIHVTLRRIGDRWLAESTIPPQVSVDDLGPALWHWIQTPGQVLHLTPNGPDIVFQPTGSAHVSAGSSQEPTRPPKDADPSANQRPGDAVVLGEATSNNVVIETTASQPVAPVQSTIAQPVKATWRFALPTRLNQVAVCVVVALFAMTLLIAATFRSGALAPNVAAQVPNEKHADPDPPDNNQNSEPPVLEPKPKPVAVVKPVAPEPTLSDEEKRKRDLELKISYTQAMRRWALQRFESMKPEPSRVDRSLATDVLDKWAKIRTFDAIVKSPERSRGAARSGRGLNFFIDILGEAAFEHELILKNLRERGGEAQLHKDLQDVDEQLDSVTSEEDRVKLVRQRESIRAQLVVFELAKSLVTHDMVRRLVVYEGLGGPKLSLQLQKGALPLQWPGYLHGHAEFHDAMRSLEKARDAAIKEIAANHSVSPATHGSMLRAVDELESLFEERFRPRIQTVSAGGPEGTHLMVTKKFLNRLRPSVYRFLESQDIDKPIFTSGTLPELISRMWHRGLQFGEASPSSETTQMMLFNMMERYHEQLTILQIAATESQMDAVEIANKAGIALPKDFDTLPNVPRGLPLVGDGVRKNNFWRDFGNKIAGGMNQLFGN